MSLIIDSSTGTIVTAHTCYLLSDEAFTDSQWDQIEDLSDSEIAHVGREMGVAVERSEQLLQAIADALWGGGSDTEWDADTLQAIADAVQTERPDLVNARV